MSRQILPMNRQSPIVDKNLTALGFTLAEVLIAGVVTSIVAVMTLSNLLQFQQIGQSSKTQVLARQNLNRGLDFMLEEMRMANSIATNSTANLATQAANFDPTNKTVILNLAVSGISQRILYYIADNDNRSLGPKVVYRWGPALDTNGNYSNPTVPSAWQYEVLVDQIESALPAPNPVCNPNWTANPPVAVRQGFYSCVDPSGRMATLNLVGRLTDQRGSYTGTYPVSGQASTRS
jgi:type II secretory pathway pseudopilin PulG